MTVTLDVTEGLATLTLARPTAHNALDVATKKAFLAAVESVAQDANVRAVLLTAEGKNFCVGQDLGDHVAALEADPATAMATVADHYNPLIRALSSLRVPVVVAVPGACVGAGWGIALTGDIRIAGERTSFATAFTGIGLASDSGLSHSLVQNLGASRAGALLLNGDKVTADQALEWGIVHQVVADDQLQAVALEAAKRLAVGPTAAYRHVKALVKASVGDLDAALEREQEAQFALGQTEDHKTAVDAFLAKQKPVFVGR